LAHEYLPVFEKPFAEQVREQHSLWEYRPPHHVGLEKVRRVEEENLETTTVWLFPKERLEQEVKRNLLRRFSDDDGNVAEVKLDGGDGFTNLDQHLNLIYVRWPQHDEMTEQRFMGYRSAVRKVIEQSTSALCQGGFLVLEAKDFRSGGMLWPAGLILNEDAEVHQGLLLKEIVIVVPEELPRGNSNTDLEIIHRYLLVYARK
jgi:hypothetical protein